MPLSNTGDSRGRIGWIDVAKALAAWMVVTAHLLRQGAVADYLAAVSVSVFFVLAGVTFHPHEDLPAWLRRLAVRIVLPYLAVGLVSILCYRLLGNYAAGRLGMASVQTDMGTDVLHLFYGSSVGGRMKWNESLWFLPCYVVVMLLSEGIGRIQAPHGQVRVVLYLSCGAIGRALIGSGHAGLPWHLESALVMLPLCGLGRYLGSTLAGLRRRPWFALLFGGGLLCYSLQLFPGILGNAGGSLSLRAPALAGVGETYLFLLVSVLGMVYLVWFYANAFPVPAAIDVIGRHSLDIVLWNKFPVLALQTLVPLCFPGFSSLFQGRADGKALLTAALLAPFCIALCLMWTALYRHLIDTILRIWR